MAKNITPLFARVVVQPKTKEETTASGIVLPDTVSKEKPMEGEIIAVGPDCKAVKKGDTVLFKKYSPTEIKIDGTEYFILDEEDLLGKLS
ncbi:co-chaperone GroES [Candidatus Peregrinibacteria bacterium]|nr:MAG: co-chaperone GroES [Candidatus Peregrinibacteria bacterium]